MAFCLISSRVASCAPPGRYVRALVLANRLDYVDLDALLGRQWREVPTNHLGFSWVSWDFLLAFLMKAQTVTFCLVDLP